MDRCYLKTHGLDPKSKRGVNEHDRSYPKKRIISFRYLKQVAQFKSKLNNLLSIAIQPTILVPSELLIHLSKCNGSLGNLHVDNLRSLLILPTLRFLLTPPTLWFHYGSLSFNLTLSFGNFGIWVRLNGHLLRQMLQSKLAILTPKWLSEFVLVSIEGDHLWNLFRRRNLWSSMA